MDVTCSFFDLSVNVLRSLIDNQTAFIFTDSQLLLKILDAIVWLKSGLVNRVCVLSQWLGSKLILHNRLLRSSRKRFWRVLKRTSLINLSMCKSASVPVSTVSFLFPIFAFYSLVIVVWLLWRHSLLLLRLLLLLLWHVILHFHLIELGLLLHLRLLLKLPCVVLWERIVHTSKFFLTMCKMTSRSEMTSLSLLEMSTQLCFETQIHLRSLLLHHGVKRLCLRHWLHHLIVISILRRVHHLLAIHLLLVRLHLNF